MASLRPDERVVRYSIVFYEGTFENDGCGFESSTPFFPIHVGDTISPRSDIPDVEGKPYRVTAVQHEIRQLGSEIVHDVHICLEPLGSL